MLWIAVTEASSSFFFRGRAIGILIVIVVANDWRIGLACPSLEVGKSFAAEPARSPVAESDDSLKGYIAVVPRRGLLLNLVGGHAEEGRLPLVRDTAELRAVVVALLLPPIEVSSKIRRFVALAVLVEQLSTLLVDLGVAAFVAQEDVVLPSHICARHP